jgi:carboxylesterase type B
MTDTLLETTGGTVRGAVVGGVHRFLGVRYGAPTGGAARFLPPRPVEPWDGVLDACAYGPSSWQRAPVGDEQVRIMREMLAMWVAHRSRR